MQLAKSNVPQLFLLIVLVGAVLGTSNSAFSQGPSGGRPPFSHGGDDGPRLAEPPEFKTPSSPNPPSLIPSAFPGSPDQDKVWKCGKCGAVLGRGPTEPKLDKCPNCGAKLASWFQYYIVGGVGGALLAGLVIVSVILKALRRK